MDTNPDPELSPEQRSQIDQLSSSDIKLIDADLLKICSRRYQKVAKIVGTFMQRHSFADQTLPDVFLASRIYELVRVGALESQGNIGHMRYCEVRITVSNGQEQ